MGDVTLRPAPGTFDAAWYATAYPDVGALGIDPWTHYVRYGRALGRRCLPDERVLRRIVAVVADLSSIGGIAARTRKWLAAGEGRDVEHTAATARSERGGPMPAGHCFATEPEAFLEAMDSWLPSDTVLLVSNNALRAFPRAIRERMHRFPIVFVCAGQMAFMLQDSTVMADREYARQMRAMRIISFSQGDIDFQRQLGIHGQVKGFVPVEQRATNAFDPGKNTRLGYIGRIDFHAKDAARLIDVARSLRGSRWGPLLVFTTDGRNSPQFHELRRMIAEEGLEDQFEFVLNQTDAAVLFDELAFLLVPSRKESFGNVVVEALSFGVPVVAAAYAPGPAEIVEHGRSGFLLDDYSGDQVAAVLSDVDDARLAQLSAHAFERHRRYRLKDHADQIEQLAREAVRDFAGENVLPVFPDLKMLPR